MLESLFNKSTGLRTCNFIKTKLQHWNFLAIIAKFLRTAFFVEHLRSLLLLFITLSAHWFLCECIHSNSADPFGKLSIKILTLDLLINIKYPNFKIIVTIKLKINGFSERIYKFKVSLLSHKCVPLCQHSSWQKFFIELIFRWKLRQSF